MKKKTNLHVTDSDAVVFAISDDLVLNLLPTLHRLLDQYLRTRRERLFTKRLELILIVRKSTSQSSQGESRSDDDRVANILGRHRRLFEVDSRRGLCALLSNFLHRPGEQLSVLGGDDGRNLGSEHLASESFKLVLQSDSDRQRGLSTKGDVDSIRLLVLEDLSNKVRGDGEVVDLVGKTLGCLDGGDVGVDEDGVDTFLLESLDRLGTRVIELSGLTDGKSSRTKDNNLLDLDSGSLLVVLLLVASGHLDGNELLSRSAIRHALDEDIEKELGILGTGGRLRVELDGEVGKSVLAHPDTLVGSVVGVVEELLPSVGERGHINLVTVVLRSDVASTGRSAVARNVHSSVSVLHLGRLGSSGLGEKLVTETDTKDGDLGSSHGLLDVLNRSRDDGGITGSVRKEETVVRLGLEIDEVVIL